MEIKKILNVASNEDYVKITGELNEQKKQIESMAEELKKLRVEKKEITFEEVVGVVLKKTTDVGGELVDKTLEKGSKVVGEVVGKAKNFYKEWGRK